MAYDNQPESAARRRAQEQFAPAKRQEKQIDAVALSERKAQQASLAKTAKLKALRLAKEAEDKVAAEAAAETAAAEKAAAKAARAKARRKPAAATEA